MTWTPPSAVLRAGETARVHNTQGSVIEAGEAPQKPVSPAVRAFYAWVLAHFGVTGNGVERASSRNHHEGERRDVHEEGRACDFKVRPIGDPAGAVLANWLVLHAERIGCQLVIWDHLEWSSSPIGTKFERYLSPPHPSPHDDHVHAELSVAASQWSAEQMRAVLDAEWRAGAPGGGSNGGGWLGWLAGAALFLGVGGWVIFGEE